VKPRYRDAQEQYPSVISVGGDGLFSEILFGVLYRQRMDSKLALHAFHTPDSPEVTPRLRIGLIPAGKFSACDDVPWGTCGKHSFTASVKVVLQSDLQKLCRLSGFGYLEPDWAQLCHDYRCNGCSRSSGHIAIRGLCGVLQDNSAGRPQPTVLCNNTDFAITHYATSPFILNA
ncbi:unnamed protein product, partial [Schistocephalus solidus]|uniref:DAGKc domain-containing protein n=1 Tax=Schistocephalus solidus TaxID=70667 RepID=A0A183TIS9_SCHSO